jgi:hypothetical protein
MKLVIFPVKSWEGKTEYKKLATSANTKTQIKLEKLASVLSDNLYAF